MAFDFNNITEEQIQETVNSLMNMGTIHELKGISDAEMEAIYSLGFSLYNTGRYDDAEKVFRFLVMYDHLNEKYWIGMGAVEQVKKDYDKAIVAYAYASFLNLDNPKSQFYAAQCFLAKGDAENALSALAALEAFCPKNTEEGREFRKKAAAMKAEIEKNAQE